MPKLFNVDHQPAVLRWHEPAIMPGESHDFTDEEVAAGLGGQWSEEDPRAGLKDEREFKKRRDAVKTTDTPAESGEKE